MNKLTSNNEKILSRFAKNKKPSLWARTPTFYKAAILAALWFLFVYMPSLGLK